MAEKHLEAKVIRAIRDLGGEVDSFSQVRRGKCHSCGAPQHAGTMQTPGIPDLRVSFPARGIKAWIEVKWKRNKPTPAQRAWMLRELQLGTLACPIWSINDLVWVLGILGVPVYDGPVRDDVSPGTLEFTDKWVGRA